jgi:hypothetical protein
MNVTMFKFYKKLVCKSLGANLILKKLLKDEHHISRKKEESHYDDNA